MVMLSPHRRLLHAVSAGMKRVVPVYAAVEVDMERARASRASAMRRGQRLTYTAMVTKAIAQAIEALRAKHPLFSAYTPRLPFLRAVPAREIRAAVMVARVVGDEDHVFPGMIENPQDASVEEISTRLRDYARAAVRDVPAFRDQLRMQRLPILAMRALFSLIRNAIPLCRKYHGTFFLTSIGKFGPDLQLMPTLGMTFGFGAIRKRAVVVGDRIEPRLTMNLSVTFDRRFFNGAPCSELLMEVKRRLEEAALDGPPETPRATNGSLEEERFAPGGREAARAR